MTETWHGLSHKQAWGNVGDSFAQLSLKDVNTAAAAAAAVAKPIGGQVAAGIKSASTPKGAGSFQLQVTRSVLFGSSSCQGWF